MIPGVDDGASSLDESLAALKEMERQGVTHVITTPHLRASDVNTPRAFELRMNQIDKAWEELRNLVSSVMPHLRLDRGVELALDEPSVSTVDARLRLGGTRFLLVEFPYFTIPPNSSRALAHLRAGGTTPIVAHPERYENLEGDMATLFQWKTSGAYLQLNAGSLVGTYGPNVEKRAWQCLEAGVVDFLASDYHARGTCRTESAKRLLEQAGGIEQFRMLTWINGRRLLDNVDPAPVPTLMRPKRSWRRVAKAFLPSAWRS